MSRCVPAEIGTGESKRPQNQAVAICLSTWRRAKGIPEPKEDEDKELATLVAAFEKPREELAKVLERAGELLTTMEDK